MNRRELLHLLAVAAAADLNGFSGSALAAGDGTEIYDLPPFGNVTLLHFTDCHAQLRPIYFREPSVNIGVGAGQGVPPHLVGKALLSHFGIATEDVKHTRSATWTSCMRHRCTVRSAGLRTSRPW